MAQEGAAAIQVIDEAGNFKEADLVEFCRSMKLAECGLSYAVVAIVGPQSSGKSTLLNHLFNTKFAEMDALRGRDQTTKGVWLQRCQEELNVVTPCTLVMDLEGTDGRERGEDDTAFQKQSALFALAVADIVLINIWCHDVGREQASNKPLLKTVFQVMMRLFSPRKITLMFVLRDRTKTPLSVLQSILLEDVGKVWDTLPKPSKFRETPIEEFFTLEVTALANYEEKEEQFLKEVSELRSRFHNSVDPGGLAGDRRAVVPGTGFPFSSHEIWKVIRENKDLDLPAHKVMVATVRCEEIANEKLHDLSIDEKWKKLEETCSSSRNNPSDAATVVSVEAGGGLFGKKASSLVSKYVAEYENEAAFFEEGVRTAKRNYLISRALDLMQPSYETVVAHHRAQAFNRFKEEMQRRTAKMPITADQGFADVVRCCSEIALSDFDQACEDAHVVQAGATWKTTLSRIREKLIRDINMHAQSVRVMKLQELTSSFEKQLEGAIAEPVSSLLDAASPDTWSSIRVLLDQEKQVAIEGLAAAMAGFEQTQEEKSSALIGLSEFARSIVEKKAREESAQALIRMKDRFNTVFAHDNESLPRVWGAEHSVRAITRDARSAALKLLAVLAAIQLDSKSPHEGIEVALMTLLNESGGSDIAAESSSERSDVTPGEPSNVLASSKWPGVSPADTLLTPGQCRSLWRHFKAETEYTISQALSAQEASRHGKSWMPPPWAIAAIIILGFNEFMILLRNPIYLPFVLVAFLLGKALYMHLDLSHEFQYGALPGIMSISTKLMPTVMAIFKQLVNAGEEESETSSVSQEQMKLA